MDKPIGYIAWKSGKVAWSEDCVCEDAVYPRDEYDDQTSMPIYSQDQIDRLRNEAEAADIRIENDAATIARLQSELDAEKLFSKQAIETVEEIEVRRYQLYTENTRLHGEAGVMRDLLSVAVKVLILVRQDAAAIGIEENVSMLTKLIDSMKSAIRGAQ